MKTWYRGEKLWEVGFLHMYSLMLFLGILFSFLSICYFWKRMKYSWEVLQIMLIIIVPTSIIGARLWFLIWEGGWSQWWQLSGLSIHGGVFFSTACVIPFVYAKRHLVDFRTVFSIVLPNVIVGQAIGRWGNFANHEVFGAQISTNINDSTLDWMGALKSHMFIDGAYRQPLFLYEFITSSVGYIFMVWILLFKNWLKPGVVGSVYLIWYGIVRLSMEPVRDTRDIMGREIGFDVSIFIAALSLTSGVWLFVYWQWLDLPISRYFAKKMITLKDGQTIDSKGYRFKKFVLKIFQKTFNAKEYEQIRPVKPHHKYWVFGPVIETKHKYWLWGPEVESRVIIWLPKDDQKRWSKRALNALANKQKG